VRLDAPRHAAHHPQGFRLSETLRPSAELTGLADAPNAHTLPLRGGVSLVTSLKGHRTPKGPVPSLILGGASPLWPYNRHRCRATCLPNTTAPFSLIVAGRGRLQGR
jgi:hypothetical protein